jgi:hypothetical protein
MAGQPFKSGAKHGGGFKLDVMASDAHPASSADHHYVPRFYLNRFTDRSRTLWVYEHGQEKARASTPKREGHRENYYTFTDLGYPNDAAETMLAKIETIVAPTMKSLARPDFEISDKQRGELYGFIALTFVRVPHTVIS